MCNCAFQSQLAHHVLRASKSGGFPPRVSLLSLLFIFLTSDILPHEQFPRSIRQHQNPELLYITPTCIVLLDHPEQQGVRRQAKPLPTKLEHAPRDYIEWRRIGQTYVTMADDGTRFDHWLEQQQEELPAQTVHMGEENEVEEAPEAVGSPTYQAYSTHDSSVPGMMPPARPYTQGGGARSLPVQWDSRDWDGESVSTNTRPLSTLGRPVLKPVLEDDHGSNDAQKRRLSPDKGQRNAQSQSSVPSEKKQRGAQNDRFSCPVDMGAVYWGRQRQGCYPSGMELRYVWYVYFSLHYLPCMP